MNFTDARTVADAVLFEGYLLYPYRASAQKNQIRWQFGVVVPPAFLAGQSGESAHTRAEFIAEPRTDTDLHVILRFLHLQSRGVQAVNDGVAGQTFEPVSALDVGQRTHLTWDEAVEREFEVVVPLADLDHSGTTVPFAFPATEEVEHLHDDDQRLVGRIIRRSWALSGEIVFQANPLSGPFGGTHLAIEVRNTSDWDPAVTDQVIDPARVGGRGAERDSALRRSLLSQHLMLGMSSGTFLSSQDPPEWARQAVGECHNTGMWPVLLGSDQRSDTMLCSPIILSDHPEIAPESPGDLFDGTEIDEILTLRTQTLTDAEKAEVRRTDPRAEAIIDRADGLPQEIMDRLHGAIRYLEGSTPQGPAPAADSIGTKTSRTGAMEPPTFRTPSDREPASEDPPWWDPGADASVSPETDRYPVDGVLVGRGSIVRLRPGIRRADAQDMFLVDREAKVEAVLFDIEDTPTFAVTLIDDPGADISAATGRFLYFSPDEVIPLESEGARAGQAT
ncbi:MAG: hypothetical protein ACR2HR_15420 [Euzebya sp.]